MKFSLKTIAAAVVMAAAASGANAAIDLANTNVTGTPVTTGGSEVIFYAWDAAAGASFTFDTGIKFEDFRVGSAAANTSQSFSFANLSLASSAFGNYSTAIGGDFSGTTWGVVALRAGSAGGALGSNTVATTVRDNQNLVDAGQVSGSIKSINGAGFGATLLAANAAGHAAGASLTGDFAVDGSNAYVGTIVQDQLAGKLAVEATNFVGAQGYNFYLAEATTSNSLAPVVSEYAGQWSFDGATLNYAVAAVPEPESYAMFLAGLGLMGAIARRRRAK